MSVFAGDITQKGFEKKRSKLLAQYAKSPGGVAGKISLLTGGNLPFKWWICFNMAITSTSVGP